jgi:hypothetical protein
MTDLAFSTDDVAPVRVIEAFTGPANEAITPGAVVRYDVTTGYITPAKATESAEHTGVLGVAIGTASGSAIAVTAVKRGILCMGTGLGDLSYADIVYLSNTDGCLADAAGSVDVKVGYTISAHGMGTAAFDKLLYVNM